MLTRLAYLVIAFTVGLGAIVLCRLTQATFLDAGASWITGPLLQVVGYPVRGATEVVENVRSIGELRRENERLRAELDQLRQQTVELPELQRENQMLREQLGLRQARPGYQWLPAQIIGYDASALIRSVTIDRGSRDGVADGMTVITPKGLVGRVVRANPSTSRVLVVTDVNSSINALLQASRARGVVNGSATGHLTMRYIGQGEAVRTGDRVITSGLGGSFPPGLLVGSVIDVRQKDVDMFQEARLEPAVDFSRLEAVLVITNFLPTKLE